MILSFLGALVYPYKQAKLKKKSGGRLGRDMDYAVPSGVTILPLKATLNFGGNDSIPGVREGTWVTIGPILFVGYYSIPGVR